MGKKKGKKPSEDKTPPEKSKASPQQAVKPEAGASSSGAQSSRSRDVPVDLPSGTRSQDPGQASPGSQGLQSPEGPASKTRKPGSRGKSSPGFQQPAPMQQSPVEMPPGMPQQQSGQSPFQTPPGMPQQQRGQSPFQTPPGMPQQQRGQSPFQTPPRMPHQQRGQRPQQLPFQSPPPGMSPQQRWQTPQQPSPVQMPSPGMSPPQRWQQPGQPQPMQASPQSPPGMQQPRKPGQPPSQMPRQDSQRKVSVSESVGSPSSDVAKITEAVAETKISSAAGTSNVSNLQIPHRKRIGPVVGTKGRKILIEVNHLQLQLRKTNAIAIHYDVAMKPDLPKKMLRPALEQFRRKHFPKCFPAFDGRKNLYSCGYLPFKNEIRDTVSVHDDERQREKEFDITIKFASQVDMSTLATYTQAGRATPQEAIQALDIVLRNPASLNFTCVGRSFFTPPVGQVIDLGDGLELWYGFYQSAILGWKPYLNIDVAHKGFPSAKHMIDVVMKVKEGGHPQGYDVLRNPLDNYERSNVEKFIKGLKVEYQLPNQPNTKRTYKVNCLKGPCNKERFRMENGAEMTVAEYFIREKRITLKFPAMPCLHVGNEQKTIYLPLEFCKIVAGQVVNAKLNETQTANMVRAAAKPADERKRRIMDAMRQANFNADRCIQEFGITVSQEFTKIDARILDPPKLEYCNNESVIPSKGVWRPSKFYKSNSLRDWRILNLDQRTREDALWNFAQMMSKVGDRLGIVISKPTDVRTLALGRQGASSKQPIIDYFQGAKGAQLIVVIINDREAGIYARVKQSAEINVGVLTQCIKSKTMCKMNDATCSNILLKVNSKLNGVNHQIDKSCRPKIFARPVMVVGADVTHPSPDQKTIPSVAAVAASHDPAAFQYNMLWRLQPPRQEMIEDLEEMMKNQLKFFFKKTKHKPEKIIFYRDGVSEGQFSQVLDVELKAIRRACTSIERDFKPAITFLVVQKRHHTRFFPTNPRDEDGRNKNVPAGTIVDTDITHPREMDFYLVSHASLQGTSRPTKYHKLWDDNDMDENDLEELTYYLCHLFSRCTRSVSYPAPTYYAHLAAFRARSYIEGAQISMTNLPNEQRQRTIQTAIVENSPMFFV